MNMWWSNLSGSEQILYGMAVFFSVFFVIQTVMSLIGASDDHDFSHDSHDGGDHGDGNHYDSVMDFFTLKNMVAFFLGFSWCTLAMLDDGNSLTTSMLIGVLVGGILVVLNMLLLRTLSGLQETGNAVLQDAVGHSGTVSVMVPQNKSGYGKVSVSFNGRLMEVNALTEGEGLSRGAPVSVTGISGSSLIIKPITQ